MLRRDEGPASAFERAQADLEAGLPWRAANRLQSYLADFPLAERERSLLGDVLLDMGELEAAGRILLPSERTDDRAVAEIDAWLRSVEPMTFAAAKSIATTGLLADVRSSELGPVGRERLRPVAAAAIAFRIDAREPVPYDTGERRGWLFDLGCGVASLLFGIVLVVGTVEVVGTILRVLL